jgi:hypothetical protein
MVLQLLVSGSGLRQTGRIAKLSVQGVQHKFRKIATSMRLLNRNLLRSLPPTPRTLLLDDFETFEHSSILPVTVPVAIEHRSFAILAVSVAPIRRVARLGSIRRKWLERHELAKGKRVDRSRAATRRVLGRLTRLLRGQPVAMVTDEKATYASLIRTMFDGRLRHETVSSRLPRTTFNPLFRINLTEHMLRDSLGRMRRKSWLISKTQQQLRQHLEIYSAWRNWHRRRTNLDPESLTPGVALGLTERPFTCAELLSWRQDWRERSVHPTSSEADRAVGR